MAKNTRMKDAEKVRMFQNLFTGLENVYGTYDPDTGRSWQVKKPVTKNTILDHLKGNRPYGVYLLNGNKTKAVAVDFDDNDPFLPIEFLNSARHYNIPAYVETSKSKGFHVWIFFDHAGSKASKARLVVKNMLEEIDQPQTEIFPKQDKLDKINSYGNFINAPLFGKLVPHGKTVFIDPHTLKPYSNQWDFLASIQYSNEGILDNIIELNNLSITNEATIQPLQTVKHKKAGFYGLPPCAQRMLKDGVSDYQRVSCFRLAVHFKRLGIPYDMALAALKAWSCKNRPEGNKGIITEAEIINQTSYAYNKDYTGYGCGTEAVARFCHPGCMLSGNLK